VEEATPPRLLDQLRVERTLQQVTQALEDGGVEDLPAQCPDPPKDDNAAPANPPTPPPPPPPPEEEEEEEKDKEERMCGNSANDVSCEESSITLGPVVPGDALPGGEGMEVEAKPPALAQPPSPQDSPPAPLHFVMGSVAAFFQAHPHAKRAHIGSPSLAEEDFVHLANLEELSLNGQWSSAALTARAFSHLGGLKKLSLAGCNQASLSNAALAHLTALEELCLAGCDQRSITDDFALPLVALKKLNIYACTQLTDRALMALGGTLTSLCCAQCPGLTNEAFKHLTALQELDMRGCVRITSAAFAALGELRVLDMSGCTQRALGDAALGHLARTLTRLVMVGCTQATLSMEGLRGLRGLRVLDISRCKGIGLENFPEGMEPRGSLLVVMRECSTRAIVGAMEAGFEVVAND
jgi:hypothetical protein